MPFEMMDNLFRYSS